MTPAEKRKALAPHVDLLHALSEIGATLWDVVPAGTAPSPPPRTPEENKAFWQAFWQASASRRARGEHPLLEELRAEIRIDLALAWSAPSLEQRAKRRGVPLEVVTRAHDLAVADLERIAAEAPQRAGESAAEKARLAQRRDARDARRKKGAP